jgi:tight adherence protein B
METGGWLCLMVAMAGAGGSAGVGVPLLIEGMQSLMRRVHIRGRIAGVHTGIHARNPLLRLVARVGILASALPGLSQRRVFKRLARTRYARTLASRLVVAGVALPADQLVVALSVLMAAAGVCIALVTRTFFAVAVVVAAVPVSLSSCAKGEVDRRVERLRGQLPSALSSISVSLGAGRSLSQALAYSAEHVGEPLSSELQQAVCDLEAGMSLQDAMDALERRTAVQELAFVSCALAIQQRTGGSLKDILASASRSVTDAFDLKRMLRVQTSQTKLSARIVISMPIVLLVALLIISPDYLSVFFQSTAGIAVLVIAILLDVLGVFAIRRLLDVEV